MTLATGGSVAIITARMASSRFPGKPLVDLCGMPMILHCYERARLATSLSGVYVATCDEVIAERVSRDGVPVLWTSDEHVSAMSRMTEALEVLNVAGISPECVLLVQGDEPLLAPPVLNRLVDELMCDPKVGIVNAIAPLLTEDEILDVNNVKIVANATGNACYLSRSPIPSTWRGWQRHPMFMQTGLIALRPAELRWFAETPPSPVELTESVDVLRFVLGGHPVKLITVDSVAIGVDTPADLERARDMMQSDVWRGRYLNDHA